MAVYELIIETDHATAATIGEIRKRSSLGVAEIARLIRGREPVVTVSTTDYPIELDIEDGHRRQHELVLAAHQALAGLGNRVTVRYKPSPDWPSEVVDLQVAKNLMESELVSLRQEHG